MPRVKPFDKTTNILRGILRDRGLSGLEVAKTLNKPASTINYQLDHAESMPISRLRVFVNLTKMTDAEIARVIRG